MADLTRAGVQAAKPWYKILYVQVLIAILIGVIVGWLWPDLATNDWIKALGDGFIKLIRMLIAPIIFCTVVSGISHIQDASKVGRVGIKALVYFEIVSSFALMLGLIIGNLVGLIALFYVTAGLFVVVVLGLIARFIGFSIFKFINYIKDELLIVLGTSSSESALPQLMEKLERLGCSKPVVGLVVPTGYSFNLDGTNIYMTLATLFIAQALGVELSFGQQLTILVVAMLTSKGASGVTGAGFITLAATLSVVNPALVPGMAIVFSVDKFMSEVRALTNITGNGIATVFVSWWEGELDHEKLHANLNKAIDPSDVETAVTTG